MLGSRLFLLGVLVWSPILATGARQEFPQFRDNILRNENIIVAVKQLKISDKEIIQEIRSSKTEFDLSPAAVSRLRDAGVSDAVQNAMKNATTTKAADNKDALTNDDIVMMVKAGLPENIILSSISSSEKNFDLTPKGLLALHNSGVSAPIIQAMQQGGQTKQSSIRSEAQEAAEFQREYFAALGVTFAGGVSDGISGPAKASASQWRGLILGKSSAEDAIATLGKPKKEKVDKLEFIVLEKFMDESYKKKEFRLLEYEDVDELDKVTLAFKQNRLVQIRLDPKGEILAERLEEIYGIGFRVDSYKGVSEVLKWDGEGGYRLVGETPVSFLEVLVEKRGNFFSSIVTDQRTLSGSLPGKVKVLYLSSRSLASDEGAPLR